MATEIERRFLLKHDATPNLDEATDCQTIVQAYLAYAQNVTVRVRIVSRIGQRSVSFLTVKGRRVGFEAPEFEYEIPVDDAREMVDLAKHMIIAKRRYVFKTSEGLKWELDVFDGLNAELRIAEIEMPSSDTKFTKPDWIGAEIVPGAALSHKLSNAMLALNPISKWDLRDRQNLDKLIKEYKR